MWKEIGEGRLRRVFKGQQGQGTLQFLQHMSILLSSFSKLLGSKFEGVFYPAFADQFDQLLLLKKIENTVMI